MHVFEAVQNVKITVFQQLPQNKWIFRYIFVIFVGSPTDDFRKNHDFEHDFEPQHREDAKNCVSIGVISSDPDDFSIKNHDCLRPGLNCFVWLIEDVPKLKITFFSAIVSRGAIFRDIFVLFVRSPSRIFGKITILHTILNRNTEKVRKILFRLCDFERSGRFLHQKS